MMNEYLKTNNFLTIIFWGDDVRFLIVDDSNLSRQKLRGMITELGYEVVGEAKDGLEAIDLIDKLNPTYITMDLEMPNMKGDAASKIILEKNNKINIILITSIINQKEIINALRIGVKKFLQKPFTLDKFKTIIEEIKAK